MLKIKEYSFAVAAPIILIAGVGYAFVPVVAAWIMALGVFLYGVNVVLNPYPGVSMRGKRLFQFQVFAFFLMVMGTYLMFKQENEWPLPMLCAAVFILYSSIVIPKELKKEQKK